MAKKYTPKSGAFKGQTFGSYYKYRVARDKSLGRPTVGERRDIAAKKRGFTGYGQERKARVEIVKEFDRQIEAGYLDKGQKPKVGSEGHELLLKARTEIIAQNKTFERGKDKLSLELKAELRKLYPDPRQYYPIMRSLYG